MRIAANLKAVATACAKQGCSHVDAPLHRHHKRSQKLFVHCFESRRGTARYKKFKADYWKFRKRDVVLICDWHHREIHEMYRVIIGKHMRKLEVPLRRFSWKQAELLMDAMEKECHIWLKKVTPGSPPWPTDANSH